MDKVDQYREVYRSFIALCGKWKQDCSFVEYCRQNGVDAGYMNDILGDEFQGVRHIPGYKMTHVGKNKATTLLYGRIFDDFKVLCADGRQPGSFVAYCKERGIEYSRMNRYLNVRNLKVGSIPGYQRPGVAQCSHILERDALTFPSAGSCLPDISGKTGYTESVFFQIIVYLFPADPKTGAIVLESAQLLS